MGGARSPATRATLGAMASGTAPLVLTVLGDDRPGLVSALAAEVRAQGGSWERSQMARLAGKFAGIVLVQVPEDRITGLLAALEPLEGLHVTAERTDLPPAVPVARALRLTLVGNDRPGIVADISSLLASSGVSIDELTTGVREAPMSGGLLFEADAVLRVPDGVAGDDLRAALEALADELMVELNLADES